MSLTSFLAEKDVKARFREEFEKPKFLAKKEMVASPLTKNYPRVGTAFDYLFRFILMHLNDASATSEKWVAEDALNYLASDEVLFKNGNRIVSNAKRNLSDFLKSGKVTDELIESSLLLASLDPIIRSGFGHDDVGIIDSKDIRDLRNLVDVIDKDRFKARYTCLLNPRFGKASNLVGGADADVILDDTLIDIKTTIDFRFDRSFFDQLMGYYTLNCINNENRFGEDSDIKSIAVYFSRHGYLHSIPLDEIINPLTFPDFIKWFVERANIRSDAIRKQMGLD